MTNSIVKATTVTAVDNDLSPVLLGDSEQALGECSPDLFGGDSISWAKAAEAVPEAFERRSILVELGDLLSREAVSRHRALVNVCQNGSEVLVVSGPNFMELGGPRGKMTIFPIGPLEASVSAIKSVLPFEAHLVDVGYLGRGQHLFRLVLGRLTSPVLGEVAPVPQRFWADGVFGLYLSSGFHELEYKHESSFSWMGRRGIILVKSSATQIVKVELWVEPFIPRPQKLKFRDTEYLLVGKRKVTAYGSIIPGYNPFELVMDGDVDSPLDRGLSTDSRKIGLKVVGGSVLGL